MKGGAFRYDIDHITTRIIPGPKHYVAQVLAEVLLTAIYLVYVIMLIYPFIFSHRISMSNNSNKF